MLFSVSAAALRDSHKKRLKSLMQLYTFYECQTLHSLPQFGTYCPTIDTSLIERYKDEIEHLLALETLSDEEKQFIESIAYKMIRGPVYRNASCISRWKNYAKQAIIQSLSKHYYGLWVLESLAKKNPQLETEIEAYTMAFKAQEITSQ